MYVQRMRVFHYVYFLCSQCPEFKMVEQNDPSGKKGEKHRTKNIKTSESFQ